MHCRLVSATLSQLAFPREGKVVKGKSVVFLSKKAFPLPTTASSPFQGSLKDSDGETVMACDMPEPRKFPSFDNCQKRFMWTYEGTDLVPHPVVGLVL